MHDGDRFTFCTSPASKQAEDAFTFGAPPHGGIAFGWDRIVALLAGVDAKPVAAKPVE